MNNGLNDVSMGAGNGWAVGYALVPTGSSPAYQALAMHWDGGSWTLAPPPTPNASADAILTGVDTVGPARRGQLDTRRTPPVFGER